MTIKQFAYLAAGIILGWITFILPLFILIKLPFVFIFIGLGVAAAFLPIEGRPFDVMIGNYFKALVSPTQYIYQKMGGHIWFPDPPKNPLQVSQAPSLGTSEQSSKNLQEFLKGLPQKPMNKLDQKEMNFLNALGSMHGSPVPQAINPTGPSAFTKIISMNEDKPQLTKPEPIKSSNPNNPSDIRETKPNEEKLDKSETEIKKELEEAKIAEQIQAGSEKYEAAHGKVLDLEKVLSDVSSQKQDLENQILELRRKLDQQNQKVFTPTTATAAPQTQSVRKIPKILGKATGLPFVSDVPNLIMGIIKDPRGNPIANILVEVKDSSANPVRAFKTNVLGQFASATPLGNGTYTMSFEDTKNFNKFDSIEIKATGEVFMPIEVISIDSREELRRSLFSQTQKNST